MACAAGAACVLLGKITHRALVPLADGSAFAGHVGIRHRRVILGADSHVVPAAGRALAGGRTTDEGEAEEGGDAQRGQGGCQGCFHEVGLSVRWLIDVVGDLYFLR